MEFIDNTGHIFSLPSFEQKPIGYEYEERDYIFWILPDSYNFLSVNNYYAKTINVLINLSNFGLNIDNKVDDNLNIEVSLSSKVYKFANPTYLQESICSNSSLLDIVDISDHCSDTLTNDDIFLVKTSDNYSTYAIMPLYVIGKADEPGTWISNILIHISSKDGSVNDWCPISVGGEFQEAYEQLIIHGQNMGVSLPKEIIKAVYQASFINDNFNETLYNQKLKEYMLNFMEIKGEQGNFKAAINGLKWFGYGDKLTISKLLATDNNIKQQFYHDFFDINYDLLDSFKTFRNSTYVALRLKINMESGKYEPQDIGNLYENMYNRILDIECEDKELMRQSDILDTYYENDWTYIGEEDTYQVNFAGEGNPILEDLLSKNIKVKIGHKNEQYDYITSYFNFSMFELGIKLACLKYYYEKYFLPIHLKVHSATLAHKVYANDIKLTSVHRINITEQPICTEDTDYDVIFPADHVHYFKKQTHYVDENFNEFDCRFDEQTKNYLYLCDTCVNIPITFTSVNKYYDCVLILEKKTPKKLHMQYIYNNNLLFNIDRQLALFDDKNQTIDLSNMKFALKFYDAQKFSPVFLSYKEMIRYLVEHAEVYETRKIVENRNELSLEGVGDTIELTNNTQYIHQTYGHFCYIVPSIQEAFKDAETGNTYVKILRIRDYYIKILPGVDYVSSMIQYKSDNIYNSDISFKYFDEFNGFEDIVILDKNKLNFFYESESTKIFESHFRFIQNPFVGKYLNFIIYPKAINKNVNYWIDNDFIIRLLVNNKWFNYEFALKIPEFHVDLGKLEYKYWLNPENYITNFAQLKYIDKDRIIFNSFMHEPELVTVNNANYVPDLIKMTQNEHLRFFHKDDLIQNGNFYKYIDFNGHKIYIHESLWYRDLMVPVQYLIDHEDWKNLYMFVYNQYVYLYEESGTTIDKDVEYAGKLYDTIGQDYANIPVDSYQNDELINLGLVIDRNNNDRPGYSYRTNFVWIKYSDSYLGKFMSNHPVDKNGNRYKFIGIAYDKLTSIEGDDESEYIWTDIISLNGTAIPEPGTGLYTFIKYANEYPTSNSELYDIPTINTKWIGIAVNQSNITEADDYTIYSWNVYKDGEGILTNKDGKIYWEYLDENLDRYILFNGTTPEDYESMGDDEKDSVTKIYIDIPETTPILKIPKNVLNETTLRLFTIQNCNYIINEEPTETKLVTKYYLDEGGVIGEEDMGIMLEDEEYIDELVFTYVPEHPSYYTLNGKRYDIFESLHKTRVDLLRKYMSEVNIAPSNKYLNSVILFDLYKKELNANLTDSDNVLNLKNKFNILCQGIEFEHTVKNYGKIHIWGKQEFNGLTTDNIDLFSFYWNNKENYDEISAENNVKDGLYVYQMFDENNNILPYMFSSDKFNTYYITHDIEKEYINFIIVEEEYKNKFIYIEKTDEKTNKKTKTLGLILDEHDFEKNDDEKNKINVNKIVNNIFVKSLLRKENEKYFINNYEIVFKIRFIEFKEDGTYEIVDRIKNISYDSLYEPDSTTKIFLDIKLLEERVVTFTPIEISKIRSNRIKIKFDAEENKYYVIVNNENNRYEYTVKAFSYDDNYEYVKENKSITDNPGLFWIDVKNEGIELFNNKKSASNKMNDAQTLQIGNNIESSVSAKSVINSIDDYLTMIENNYYHDETTNETYENRAEVEYFINPYTYKNYLQFNLTGQTGMFKLHYETNYSKCRMIVYIIKEDGTSEIINTNDTLFELTGKEQKVLALFQIDSDENVLNKDDNWYIKPYIYKVNYVLNPIKYEDTYVDDWSKMKIKIFDKDLEYMIGNNTGKNTLKLYNDFFKEEYTIMNVFGGRYFENEYLNQELITENSVDDKNFKIQTMRFIYKQAIELSKLYLDYDMYLMHDFEKWHVIFISRDTCDKVLTPDQLNIKSYDDIEHTVGDTTYLLKFVKHEKQFLINRMKCKFTNGVNHFKHDDIIVGSVRNNKRLPVDLDISSKWNANLMSVGKSKKYEVSSNNEMGIISIPNHDNQYEAGYYNIDVDYSLNGFNQQSMKGSSRFLVK